MALGEAIGRIDEELKAAMSAEGEALPLARDIRMQLDLAGLGRTKRPGLSAVQKQLRKSRIERLGVRGSMSRNAQPN